MSGDSAAQVPEQILDYLQQHTTMTLATASPTGMPHAATMVYVNDGPVLYFCTRPETTTASHIEHNPVASFTIADYSSDWREMRGVQGTGAVYVVLSASSIADVMALFQQKFPSLSNLRTHNLSVFRLTPTALRYIDNQQAGDDHRISALAHDWNSTLAYNVFRALPSHQADDVVETLTSIQAQAGEIIVRQGAPADKFFIIADGEVDVLREEGGETHHVARLTSGQFFGEMAVLRDLPRTATVRAVVPTTVLAMPGEVFRGVVAQSLSTTADFDQLMHRRFQELDQVGKGG